MTWLTDPPSQILIKAPKCTLLAVHQALYITIHSWTEVSEGCVRVMETWKWVEKKDNMTKRSKRKTHGEWVKRRKLDSLGNGRNTSQGHNTMWLASLWMAWITATLLQLCSPHKQRLNSVITRELVVFSNRLESSQWDSKVCLTLSMAQISQRCTMCTLSATIVLLLRCRWGCWNLNSNRIVDCRNK